MLDGWRAVAILFVLAYHACLHCDFQPHPGLMFIPIFFEPLGHFGVLIFFTISGYLITGRLIADHHKTGKFSLGEFYFKRAFRILPIAYAYLLLNLILGLLGYVKLTPALLAAATFTTNYVPNRVWLTGHFWSLSVEEHFYLFWPPLIALLQWRRAFWAGVALILGVAIWRPLMLPHDGSMYDALQRTDMRLDYLMVGSIFAIAAFQWPRFRTFGAALGKTAVALALAIATALTLLPTPVWMLSVQAILLAGLVCGTALSSSKIIATLLANRPLLFLGQISYSIYILQQAIFSQARTPWLNSPLAELCKIPLIIGLAYLSYNYLELPFIRYARRRIRAREAASLQP